jgi:hypothetical protein
MLRISGRRTPRTSLRSHSTCHSRVDSFILTTSGKFRLTRSRHKRSLWLFRSAVSRRPCRAPFWSFFVGLVEVDFSSFFRLSNNFFVIYIIINTALTSSHHQNVLSARHEIVKTRQHTKNGQKWLFLRVSKKGLKWLFLACFWPHRKITFFWHQHIINTSKNEALKKCLKKMSFWKKSKIF